MTAAIPVLREATKLLAELEKDEFWSSYLTANPEQANAFEMTSTGASQMVDGVDMLIQGLTQMSASMSLTLESFKTARGEVGKPSEDVPGLN
jgi:hypothetical protein